MYIYDLLTYMYCMFAVIYFTKQPQDTVTVTCPHDNVQALKFCGSLCQRIQPPVYIYISVSDFGSP